jgi:hypothetical protein
MIKEKLKKYKLQLKQVVMLNLKICRLEKTAPNSDILKKYIDLLDQINVELKEIDIAFECLDIEDAYLIKEHYICGREWLDIEIEYNKNFRRKPRIDSDALRKKAERGLKILKQFFEPVYELEMECVNA